MDFQIEKCIPVPIFSQRNKYPFADMAVGDSFSGPIRLRKAIYASAYDYGKKHDRKFVIVAINQRQARCWRVR